MMLNLQIQQLIKDLEREKGLAHLRGEYLIKMSCEVIDEVILPLLKSLIREPARLLSLEETAATLGASPVWVEQPSSEEPVISLYAYDSGEGFGFVDSVNFNVEYRKDFFNRSWRVWDRKPTDEEREAVKWND